MIGECQVMSPADKYAAYLKGFKPLYTPRNRTRMFDDQHGAKICAYSQKGKHSTQKRLIIWGGFKNLFENCDVSALYNEAENAFVLVPAEFGLRVRPYSGNNWIINNAPIVDAIAKKFQLNSGATHLLRTKRVGDLLFIYDPKTPI